MSLKNFIAKHFLVFGIVLLLISNIFTATIVWEKAKNEVLIDQFVFSMNAANEYFESYERYRNDMDKKNAISELGSAVKIAYQVDENSRIYKERNLLARFYDELQRDNDTIPSDFAKDICQKLSQNPCDMTAYVRLSEVLNQISYS